MVSFLCNPIPVSGKNVREGWIKGRTWTLWLYKEDYDYGLLVCLFVCLFVTGFLCVALAVLEPTLQTWGASENSAICLPLPPNDRD